MPREMIVLAIALLFGAWMVIDQRSLTEKLGLIVIVIVVYVIYQYLGGASLSDIYNSFAHFFTNAPPPSSE